MKRKLDLDFRPGSSNHELEALSNALQRQGVETRVVSDRKANRLSADPILYVQILLGSAAVVELAKGLHTWLKSRRPQFRIRIRTEFSEIEIESSGDLDQIVTALKKLKE